MSHHRGHSLLIKLNTSFVFPHNSRFANDFSLKSIAYKATYINTFFMVNQQLKNVPANANICIDNAV